MKKKTDSHTHIMLGSGLLGNSPSYRHHSSGVPPTRALVGDPVASVFGNKE